MVPFTVDVSLHDGRWVVATAQVAGRVVADSMADVDRVAREFIATALGLPVDEVAVRIGVVRLAPNGTRSPAEILQRRSARRRTAPAAPAAPAEAPAAAPVVRDPVRPVRRRSAVRRERASSQLGLATPLVVVVPPADDRTA